MENYKTESNSYVADDGFVFRHKNTQMLAKKIHISKLVNIAEYEVIPEPIEEVETDE